MYTYFRGLSDVNGDGQMDFNEFSIACKLIDMKLKNVELPKTLPPSMRASLMPLAQLPKTLAFPFDKKLGRKLFLDKEFCDVKIFCEDKILDCHKVVLSLQSEVFERMLANNNMAESTSGEIKATVTSAITLEALLYFLYNDNVDENKITGDLLIAANYYMVSGLVSLCVSHFTSNLTDKNAADVMVAAYKTNQKELFGLACGFVQRLKVPILETEAWEKMKKKDPNLACEMMAEAMFNPH